MYLCGSQRNLKAQKDQESVKTEPTSKRESCQPRILVVKSPRKSWWLVNSAADMHICNNQRLITKYTEKPIRVGGSTANGISPSRGKVKI